MNKLLLSFFLPMFSALMLCTEISAASSPDSLVYFQGNWKDAMQQSKIENKPLMALFSTSWCGFCKKLKNISFTKPEIISFINSHFVLFEQNAESEEGKAIAASFGIGAYPTIVFLNTNGSPLLTSEGYHEPGDLLQLLRSLPIKK